MKKMVVFIMLIAVCFLVACQADEKIRAIVPEPASFINFDKLEQYGSVTSTGKEYSDEELKKLEKDDDQKEYEVVIQNYVSDELQKNISYMNTVDGTYNPRKVVVGTQEGITYLLTLNKWYNYSGIWTVSSHARYYHDQEVVPPNEYPYTVIDINTVTEENIRKEMKDHISAQVEGQFYFQTENTFYVLLVSGENKSVELLNVFGELDFYLNVQYAYIENKQERYGEEPYVLFKIAATSISDLLFIEYSPAKRNDIRLNMP